MSLPRNRFGVLILIVAAFTVGAWQLFGPGIVRKPVAPLQAQVAEAEKVPGLAAPTLSSPTAQPVTHAPAAPQAPLALEPLEQATASPPTATPTTRQYRVALQVGHYKNSELPQELKRLIGDVGTAGGGRTEVSLNLDISSRVAAILRAQGILVDMLPATVPTGYNADAFIAIHADGNASSAPRGFKISTRWRSNIAWQDVRLVELLTGSYGAATGLPEDFNVTKNMRGYYAFASFRPNYRVSNFTPSAIVEMGYMTNPADRAVMFNAPDKVASGIASGIVSFLQEAYGSPRQSRTYGYGITDSSINPNAPWETPGARGAPPSSPSRATSGNWQVMLMGKLLISAYSETGGGQVVARLPRDHFYHATQRKGDYYLVDLPGGGQGWISRMALVVQG